MRNRLGRIARTISGSGFPPAEQGSNEGDLPFVKVSDLALPLNYDGIISAGNWVTEDTARRLGAKIVPPGWTVFPKVGAALLGNARGYVRTSIVMDNNMMAVGSSVLTNRFLYWWLRTVDMGTLSQGGALPFVSDTAVRDLGCPTPSSAEQLRIADFLDDRVARIDQIIAARVRQSDLLDAQHRELVRVLTTVGPAPGAELRSTGIAWMPSVSTRNTLWRVGQAFITASGTTPKSDAPEYYDGTVPFVTTSDLRDAPIDQLPRGVSRAALVDYSALKIFPAGTLLVAMYGATVGRLGRLRVSACTNQACCALIARGTVNADYAFYWFFAHRYDIMTLATGGGQPNISQDIVRSLQIPAPDLDGQRHVVAQLEEHAQTVTLVQSGLKKSVRLLHECKQSLITSAVTGGLDVTAASTVVPGE